MRKLTALLMLLLCVLPTWHVMAEEPALLEVHAMAIGCADGFLIRLGDANIMVDGGNANPKKPTDDVVSYLHAAGVDRLDAYIITHWHLDHCMNVNKVLEAFGDADTVVYSPGSRVPEEIDNGSVVIKVGPLVTGEHRQMKMGDVLEMGGMTITCIGPEKLSMNGGCNADSLNFVLQYGTRRFLFTGDYAQSSSITGAYRELCRDVDVFKFPHHAIEPYEISASALRVVSPEYVLVPGVASKYKVWNFADNLMVKFPQKNVYTNGDGHVVFLTDGGECFEVLTQVVPEDYAPRK